MFSERTELLRSKLETIRRNVLPRAGYVSDLKKSRDEFLRAFDRKIREFVRRVMYFNE